MPTKKNDVRSQEDVFTKFQEELIYITNKIILETHFGFLSKDILSQATSTPIIEEWLRTGYKKSRKLYTGEYTAVEETLRAKYRSISDEFGRWHVVSLGQNLMIMKDMLGKDSRPKLLVCIICDSFIGKAHISCATVRF